MKDVFKFTQAPLLFILLISAASIVHATPMCTTAVTNAQDLAGLGLGGCQFGNVIFYNFSYTYDNSNSPAEDASAVNVSFSDAGANPLMPVISFAGSWDAQNDDITDIRIHYSVAVMTGVPLTITASNMGISGNFGYQPGDSIGGSFVSGAETVAKDVPGTGTVQVNANIGPYAAFRTWGPDSAFSGNISFAGQTQISVAKDIQIFAGDTLAGGADDGQLTQIDEGLVLSGAGVPEPSAYLTLGLGLVGIAQLLRRRSSDRRKE
jgi:hypothetical protein